MLDTWDESGVKEEDDMEKFKWCFIGTGTLAKQVARQLTDSGRHELVSCYTRNFEKCKEFASKYQCKAYESVEEAIMADGVEAVYVVTPHNAHFRYVKQALELGRPVLCEKAFTVEAVETDELIAIARGRNVYLAEAMWTWFSPAANQVKRWIDERKIGNIESVKFTYHMKSINYAERVADPKRAGGALLDITIYPITYAYRLWGMPVKIESTGNIQNGIDYGEDVTLTFANGIKADISASIADFKGFEKMSIKGDNGEISAFLYHAMNKVTCKKGLFKKEVFSGSGPRINSYLDEFDTVADEIRRGLKESEKVPLSATSNVMHILDEVRSQIGLVYTELE
jgi:predicted dehydrogenase